MFLAKKPLTVWKDLMQFKRVKQAPAAECSSGIYIKVNRDTGNTDERTPPGTNARFYYTTVPGRGQEKSAERKGD